MPGGEEANRIRVWRNDAIDIEALVEKKPSHVIISPRSWHAAAGQRRQQ